MHLKTLVIASSLLWASSALGDELSAPVPLEASGPQAPTAGAPSTSPTLLEAPDRPQPMFAVRGSFFSGYPDFAGASLSLMAFKGLEFEVGGSYAVFVASLYLRGGPRFELLPRSGDTGFALAVPVLIGVRAVTGWGLNLVGGLDATYWVARHFGLSAQLTAGVVYGGFLSPDLRLAVGVAF